MTDLEAEIEKLSAAIAEDRKLPGPDARRAVAFRRLGDVARCAAEAKRTLELATKLGMVEYVAMAKASLAWVAWRQEDYPEAEKLATEALELWHGMDDPYGFDWMALWPLIAIALHRQDSSAAIGFARGLLAENQHPLPETLLNAVQKACDDGKTVAKKMPPPTLSQLWAWRGS